MHEALGSVPATQYNWVWLYIPIVAAPRTRERQEDQKVNYTESPRLAWAR